MCRVVTEGVYYSFHKDSNFKRRSFCYLEGGGKVGVVHRGLGRSLKKTTLDESQETNRGQVIVGRGRVPLEEIYPGPYLAVFFGPP